MEHIIIAVFIACFASIWVSELTKLDGGLLWWLPKYYPYPEKFAGKIIRCSICFSGWLFLIAAIPVAVLYGGWLWITPCLFLSMSISKIITK